MAYFAALLTMISYCFAGSFVLWTGPLAIGLPFALFCVAAGGWLMMRVHRRQVKDASAI
ncbi:hypothetical protein [Pontivivens insulae]|uniref:Uncharacterized protein n=1 Tax=Pontivivens insulae TaxID=1639689 RepID=A0A2R8AAG6_9RHOB|nr:hypothetical protein [Pontivivens insulae]RED12957.1 hypothetical protein DFR53_2091 [Pontivivens insulae]SPF29050.1 hypothetical protein POI8812_01355 [Pontivivens insulae]